MGHQQADASEEGRDLQEPAEDVVLRSLGWSARDFEGLNRCDDEHDEKDADKPDDSKQPEDVKKETEAKPEAKQPDPEKNG